MQVNIEFIFLTLCERERKRPMQVNNGNNNSVVV